MGRAVVTRVPVLLLRSFKTADLIPDGQPGLAGHRADWMVQTPRHTMMVDTAVGDDKPRGVAAFDHLRVPWLGRLAAAGVELAAVDVVLLTHLHADHVDWNARRVDGRPPSPTHAASCRKGNRTARRRCSRRKARTRPRRLSTPIACCR